MQNIFNFEVTGTYLYHRVFQDTMMLWVRYRLDASGNLVQFPTATADFIFPHHRQSPFLNPYRW